MKVPFKIQIIDRDIKQVNSMTLLGINKGSKLTWKQHKKISGFFCKARHYISLKVLRTLCVILRVSLSLSTLRKYHMSKYVLLNTRTNKKATKENYKNDNIFRIYRSHYPSFFKSYQFFPLMRYTKEKHHYLCFDTLIICFQ